MNMEILSQSDIVFILVLFILCFILTIIVGYTIYITNKWYKRGYNETYDEFKFGTLKKIEDPSFIKFSCNENKYYAFGAYDAYKEIKNKYKIK